MKEGLPQPPPMRWTVVPLVDEQAMITLQGNPMMNPRRLQPADLARGIKQTLQPTDIPVADGALSPQQFQANETWLTSLPTAELDRLVVEMLDWCKTQNG